MESPEVSPKDNIRTTHQKKTNHKPPNTLWLTQDETSKNLEKVLFIVV